MSENRVRGSEVSIRITRSNELLREITAIKSLTFTTNQRILTEGYLGEGAMRQDEIFDDVGLTFTVHPEGTDILELQQMISQRASRRIANDEQVSVTFRVQFPTQVIARITVPDLRFDPIPFTVSERDRYVELAMTAKASSYILSIA